MHAELLDLENPQSSGSPTVELPDVTLVAVSSLALPATLTAMQRCLRQVRFSSAVFFSDRPPASPMPEGIQWQQVAPIRSRAAYSRFMLNELPDYIATGHALCIQWDGFVLNASNWDPAFFDYDYIGAPWPQFDDGYQVGNGGFSLRSKKLLNAARQIDLPGELAEDVAICRHFRPDLEAQGIRFAPLDVARRFSFERYDATGAEFGFHGIFNLVRMLPPTRAAALVEALERQLLSRSEHVELLRWSLRYRAVRLAAVVLKRMLSRLL